MRSSLGKKAGQEGAQKGEQLTLYLRGNLKDPKRLDSSLQPVVSLHHRRARYKRRVHARFLEDMAKEGAAKGVGSSFEAPLSFLSLVTDRLVIKFCLIYLK